MALPDLKYFIKLIIFIILSLVSVDAITQYTKQEREALDKLRPMVIDVIPNEYQKADRYLIRWLRAKDLDVNSARKMFLETLKWRAENKLDSILHEASIFDGTGFPDSNDEFDAEGCPILMQSIGKLDFRRFILEGKRDKLFRAVLQMYESLEFRVREASNRTGTDIKGVIDIVDNHGFNRKQHLCVECVVFILEYVHAFENHYPELQKLTVIVNVPRVYSIIFPRIRDAQSRHTRETTHLFSQDRTEWSTFLDKYVAPEKRTYQFGGTKKL